MRQWLIRGIVIVSLLCVPQIFKRMTHGFRWEKVSLAARWQPQWAVHPLLPDEMADIQRILSQPFTYLNRGAQSYVFASQDGRHVLKFFRSFSKPFPWRSWFREKIRQKAMASNQEEKMDRLLAATQIAFEQGSTWTGIAYAHLNPTHGELPNVTLRDRLGREQAFDLNRARFVLQKRGVPIQDALLEALKQKDVSIVRALLRSFAERLHARASQQIRNGDLNVYRNFGCVGTEVIEWDFGNYQIDASLNAAQEVRRFAFPLHAFLAKHGPQWLDEYDQAMDLR